MGNESMKSFVTTAGKNFPGLQGFFQYNRANPCQNCSAPCCNMFILDYPTPFTFMHLDFMRFVLGFPGVSMLLGGDGSWQIKIEKTCRHFDTESGLCTIYESPQRPKTCQFFNPYNCFYKKNFISAEAPDVIVLDLAALDKFIDQLKFDEQGNIIETIGVQDVRDLLLSKNKNGRDLADCEKDIRERPVSHEINVNAQEQSS